MFINRAGVGASGPTDPVPARATNRSRRAHAAMLHNQMATASRMTLRGFLQVLPRQPPHLAISSKFAAAQAAAQSPINPIQCELLVGDQYLVV